MTLSNIYVLYNAKASLLGKFEYTCRKITAPSDSSPCSACDLTHGGLRLNETSTWKDTKNRINANVKQLHKDELTTELKEFVKTNEIKFPAVLGQADQDKLKVLIDAEGLSSVSKDHQGFLSLLIKQAEKEGVPLSLRGANEPTAAL